MKSLIVVTLVVLLLVGATKVVQAQVGEGDSRDSSRGHLFLPPPPGPKPQPPQGVQQAPPTNAVTAPSSSSSHLFLPPPPNYSTSPPPAVRQPPPASTVTGSSPSSSSVFLPPPPGWRDAPQSTYNTTDFCGGAFERETQNDSCPVQPPYYVNDRLTACADRRPTDISQRYGAAYRDMILNNVNQAAESSGMSPALIMALIDAESRFNPMANNSQGDTGMTQFQVGTAQSTLNYWRTHGQGVPLRSYDLETSPPTSQCSRRDYPNLSAACRESLMTEAVCGSESTGLRPNLFCPQFAIHMMAWHLKRTSVSQRIVNFNGQSLDVVAALQGDGDPVAQARFLASTYNRGCLIQNSLLYFAENNGSLPTARNYGHIWSAPVSSSYRSTASRPCGTARVLFTERINRCYMWRVTGLCGGFGDSLVGQYLRLDFCSPSSGATGSGGTLRETTQ